jgi:hypothetical protein
VRAAEVHARHDADALAAEVLAMEARSDPNADIPVEARFYRATAPLKAAYGVSASIAKAVAAMKAATPAAVTTAPTTVASAAPAVLRERRRRDRDTDEAREAECERERSPPIHGQLLSSGKITTALASAFPGHLGRRRKSPAIQGSPRSGAGDSWPEANGFSTRCAGWSVSGQGLQVRPSE